jgi:tetratricopeptide (TPR) repeat protein
MITPALAAVVLLAAPLDEQIHQKRLEQLALVKDVQNPEPELLFRVADLQWEEARYWLLEGDQQRSDAAQQAAVSHCTRLFERFPAWERTDEVLSAMGVALIDLGDDKRALVAFKRLVERFPNSPRAADAWFRIGEYWLGHAEGRGEWLHRAKEAYARAGTTPEVRFKQAWTAMALLDFDAALRGFAEVSQLGAARAKEARSAFVMTWVRSGGKPTAARAELTRLTTSVDERRALEQQLAERYHADGFDRDAAVVWQALISERPDAPEAFGYQTAIVDAVMRLGNKELTTQQVRKLVKLSASLPASVDRSGAEELLAKLATQWHVECRKTKAEGCLGYAAAAYESYLAIFPTAPRAYELHFFFAELLFDTNDFARAASEYRAVIERDARCKVSGACQPGKFLEKAALGEIHAREALALRDESKHGGLFGAPAMLATR